MRLDKKVTGGEIRFVLARRIGRAEPGHKIRAPWFARLGRARNPTFEHLIWPA